MVVRVSELGNGAAKAGNGHAKAALGSYGDLDDRMLVLDFQAGNDEAFAEIHRRYSGLARHVCQRILRNPADADEATQEAMLRVYQGLPRFNGRYRLQPWVARIATNVSLDVTRAWARRPLTGDQPVTDLHEDLHDRSGNPQELMERALDREQINQVLEEMPDHHREALVLREFEGRSHKEIGEAMGVTPSQAKALIHRAKGSFKRAWNGGKGLQAFLLLLVALAKVPQLVKRVLQPAQDLAATSAAASAAAAPAATSSVVTAGERVTAAALAVLVAGSAAVGAVALKHKSQEPKPASSPSFAIVAPPPPVEPPIGPIENPRKLDRSKTKMIPAVVVSPPASPAPSSTGSPSPSPSGSPSPSPTPILPAPPWDLTLESSVLRNAGPFSLVSSHVLGTVDREIVFSQAVTGQGLDAKGKPAWNLYAEYWGSAQPAVGTVNFWFFLDTPAGRYSYQATGTLKSLLPNEDGGVSYTFTGSYSLTGGPISHDLVPHDGSVVLVLGFWQDGATLYAVDLSLLES